MKRELDSSVALDRGGVDMQLRQELSPSLASSQTTIRNSNDAYHAQHLELYTSPPAKRPLNGISPAIAPMPTKRKLTGDFTGENGKSYPTRRRALQACEACRSKKSKCDNDRPSCGSCVQHGIECIYKASNMAPTYMFTVFIALMIDWILERRFSSINSRKSWVYYMIIHKGSTASNSQ